MCSLIVPVPELSPDLEPEAQGDAWKSPFLTRLLVHSPAANVFRNLGLWALNKGYTLSNQDLENLKNALARPGQQ